MERKFSKNTQDSSYTINQIDLIDIYTTFPIPQENPHFFHVLPWTFTKIAIFWVIKQIWTNLKDLKNIKQNFSVDTTDIQGLIILVIGSCLVYFKMFSSIPSLYPLDASSKSFPLFLVVTAEHVCRYCQLSAEKQNCPQLRITDIKYSQTTKKKKKLAN